VLQDNDFQNQAKQANSQDIGGQPSDSSLIDISDNEHKIECNTDSNFQDQKLQ